LTGGESAIKREFKTLKLVLISKTILARPPASENRRWAVERLLIAKKLVMLVMVIFENRRKHVRRIALIFLMVILSMACNTADSLPVVSPVVRITTSAKVSLMRTWTPKPYVTSIPPITPTPTPWGIEVLAIAEAFSDDQPVLGRENKVRLSFYTLDGSIPLFPANMPIIDPSTFEYVRKLVSSPDGQKLAFWGKDKHQVTRYYVLDLINGQITPIKLLPGYEDGWNYWSDNQFGGYPSWSSNGKVISFTNMLGGVYSYKHNVISIISGWDITENEIYTETEVSLNPQNRIFRQFAPSWSPNGRWLAYIQGFDVCMSNFCDRTEGKLILKDLQNGTTRVLADQVFIFSREADWVYGVGMNTLVWSPDSKWIAYHAGVNYPRIGLVNVETGDVRFPAGDLLGQNPVWSPDSQQIVFVSSPHAIEDIYSTYMNKDTQFELFRTNLDGSYLTNLTNSRANELWPSWSPSGKWISYLSDENDLWVFKLRLMEPNGTIVKFPNDILVFEQPAWVIMEKK
jgi:Tol biopolymer transport system component